MAVRGQVRRVGRGLYTSADGTPSVHQSAIEVTRQAPKAVVCLLSALEIHGIGVQSPFEVWIALPAGTHAPKSTEAALRVTRLSGAAFTEGIETVVLDGAPVRVYTLAKTITDCFKLRSKVGLDVALEALREAWQQRKVTMDDLWRYSKRTTSCLPSAPSTSSTGSSSSSTSSPWSSTRVTVFRAINAKRRSLSLSFRLSLAVSAAARRK